MKFSQEEEELFDTLNTRLCVTSELLLFTYIYYLRL
jgi:hypothetical protein